MGFPHGFMVVWLMGREVFTVVLSMMHCKNSGRPIFGWVKIEGWCNAKEKQIYTQLYK